MRDQGAEDAEVESMLRLLHDFEAKCLTAQPPAAPEECKQVRWCWRKDASVGSCYAH